jgi:hypothetical protein
MASPGLHALPGKVDEQSSTSPEALLISAMLELGQFTPSSYHVDDDDVEAWKKLWLFCTDYQVKASVAPPVSLVKKKFADFELTPDVSADWAASKVLEASASRVLRTQSKAMLAALGENDLDGAFDALEQVKRPRGHRKPPANVFDHSLLADQFEVSRIPVPYRTLTVATKGGIGPGELWYLAARLGQGKSWELMGYAAHAALSGYRVGVASLEMPAHKVARRALMRMVGRNDTYLSDMLASDDEVLRKQAMDILGAKMDGGSLEIVDPSHGRINTTTAISEMCHDHYDLVIVDHAGLLMTADNRRAIDDWRAMAVISNILREITLSTGTPILAAAQVNREGEGGNQMKAPKVSQLSQSDALGQDADVVIMMRRQSERIMVHDAGKVREGPSLSWLTRFDPANNLWDEISPDAAAEIRAVDDDRMDARTA